MIRRELVTTLFACAACTGTDVGNPLIIDVDVVTYGGLPTETQALWGAPSGSVDEVWVSVDRVRLRPASAACGGENEIDLDGPFPIDTRDASALPELSNLEIDGGQYCRFELRWQPYDGSTAGVPTELAGASFFIGGTVEGTPFVIRTDRSDELRLDAVAAEGFPITDATNALLVSFDVEALLTGVDLEGATPDGDGTIRIEDGSNDAQLTVFEANLDALAELFDDDDDDRQLDPDERDDTDVLAESP